LRQVGLFFKLTLIYVYLKVLCWKYWKE